MNAKNDFRGKSLLLPSSGSFPRPPLEILILDYEESEIILFCKDMLVLHTTHSEGH